MCKFYLAGSCAYGKQCRFDHVRPKTAAVPARPAAPALAPIAAVAATSVPSQPPRQVGAPGAGSWAAVAQPSDVDEPSAALAALNLAAASAPPDAPPAASAAAPRGDVWAALASGDGGDADAAAAAASRRAALEASADVECAICLERVLSKPALSERRFGLLSHCAHAFCLACIRGWRGAPGEAATAAASDHARTCPVCRVRSHFIAPALTWPRDDAEKGDAIAAYTARLAAVPCRHFDQGRGSCPFGSSCWYAHRYADGSEAAAPNLRKYGTADGDVRVVEPVRLSAFLERNAAAGGAADALR